MPFCFIFSSFLFFSFLLYRLPYIKFCCLDCAVLFGPVRICFVPALSVYLWVSSARRLFFAFFFSFFIPLSLSRRLCSYLQMLHFMRESLLIFFFFSSLCRMCVCVCMYYCCNGYTILLSMECYGDVFLFCASIPLPPQTSPV